MTKPKEWNDWDSDTGQIEMLCPSDINTTIVTQAGEEMTESRIDGIPDRTISVLLNHLSDAWGANVVRSDATMMNFRSWAHSDFDN